jgi:hypothetical protein
MAVPIDLRARVRGNGLADSCCSAGGPQLWSLSASGHAMTARSGFNRSKSFQSIQVIDVAGVVQWQNGSFPSCIRGFDSLRPLQVLSSFLACRFCCRFCTLCSLSSLVELADCGLGRGASRHITTNDPLDLLFAPGENFGNHPDRKTRDVEFRGRSSPEVVEMEEIATVDLGGDFGSIERRAETVGGPRRRRTLVKMMVDRLGIRSSTARRSSYSGIIASRRPRLFPVANMIASSPTWDQDRRNKVAEAQACMRCKFDRVNYVGRARPSGSAVLQLYAALCRV